MQLVLTGCHGFRTQEQNDANIDLPHEGKEMFIQNDFILSWKCVGRANVWMPAGVGT